MEAEGEELLDLFHDLLVDAEDEDVVFRLDYRILVRDEHRTDTFLPRQRRRRGTAMPFAIAHDCSDESAIDYRQITDSPTNHLRILFVTVRDDLERFGSTVT